MILWDYVVAISHYVITGFPKPSAKNKQLKYAEYLRTNQLNRKYKPRLTLAQMKIVEHLRNLKKFARSYWFIVLPLHGVLTAAYISLYFLASRRTIDTLKWFNINQEEVQQANDVRFKYFRKIPKKTMEEIAITLILMKLSAPIRFATTFVGSKQIVKILRNKQLINCLMLHQLNTDDRNTCDTIVCEKQCGAYTE